MKIMARESKIPHASGTGFRPIFSFIRTDHPIGAIGFHKYYFTASFKLLPAVNFGTVIAGIMIFAFV